MALYHLFLRYLPLLVVATPLVGLANVLILHLSIPWMTGQRLVGEQLTGSEIPNERLTGTNLVWRMWFSNICLSVSLLTVMILEFDFGPHRSGFGVAQSYQFFSRIMLVTPEVGGWGRHSFEFGIDGLSLPLIAMVVLLPLLVPAGSILQLRDRGIVPIASMFCLQSSILLVLTSLDWRLICGGIFVSALFLRLLMSQILPARILRKSNRWSGRLLLGDALVAGGTMYFFLLASGQFLPGEADTPAIICGLGDFFAQLEWFEEDAPERVAELSVISTVAVAMILSGVLFRLSYVSVPVWEVGDETNRGMSSQTGGGVDPDSSTDRDLTRTAAMWCWLYGPVCAVMFALRAYQVAPETTASSLIPVRAVLIVWLLVAGLVSTVSRQELSTTQRQAVVPDFRSLHLLLIIGLCTPNATAMAGVFLMLGGLPLVVLSKNHAIGAAMMIPVVSGTLAILTGLLQGSGSGARGILELLVCGTGLFLSILSWISGRGDRQNVRNNSLFSLATTVSGQSSGNTANIAFGLRNESEQNRLNDTIDRREEQTGKQDAACRLRSEVLRGLLILALLLLPQQLWKRIRWDVQKIAFPVVSARHELSLDAVTDSEASGHSDAATRGTQATSLPGTTAEREERE